MAELNIVEDLLARCSDVRAHRTPVAHVLRDGLERLGWPSERLEAWDRLDEAGVAQAGPSASLYRAGMAIARLAEDDTRAAYHNRDHTAEAVLAATALALAEPWSSGQRQSQGLRLLVAMAAHDVGHSGAFGAPKGSLEEASAATWSRTWERFAGPSPGLLARAGHDVVHAVVLGTEFTEGPRQNFANQEREPQHLLFRLQVLANDADILLSVLPQSGPERGKLLAQEWQEAGPHAAAAAATVGTWAGRLGFLKAVSLKSRGAKMLGAEELRHAEIRVLETAGPATLAELPEALARQRVLDAVPGTSAARATVRQNQAPSRHSF